MNTLMPFEKRLFGYFLEWYWKGIETKDVSWLFDKKNQRVYRNGEDFTPELFQWFNIKMSKGDTTWLQEDR